MIRNLLKASLHRQQWQKQRTVVLTSTVDADDAPSTVDGGVALHGNLLNAPCNLFTASSSSRQQWFVAEYENGELELVGEREVRELTNKIRKWL